MKPIIDIKSDRMRYTKNTISATLSYVAILLNAFYFISVYSTDIGTYFYKIDIGISVIYNLLFMLFVFLASEGVKAYDYKFSSLLIALGVMQIVRIFGIPMTAYFTFIKLGTQYVQVMEFGQFILCVVCLVASGATAIAGGVIGLVKTRRLRNYEKKIGVHK
jgi:hypothetical protein